MSLIMLIFGAILFVMGRFEFGTIKAEGRSVKAAGVILMLPEALSLALALFIGLSFGSNPQIMATLFNVVGLLVFVGMIIAAGLAYVLLARPENAPRLPGILGEIQAEAGHQAPSVRPVERQPIIEIEETRVQDETPAAQIEEPVKPRIVEKPQPAPRRGNYPPVMGLREAASYLQVSEDDVMALIESGKLAAARVNYRYQIARSQLDDLLQSGDRATP